MLVLSRKKKEAIKIGDGINITILEIGKNTVVLGIDAPEDTLILRSELIGGDKSGDTDRIAE